jgi:hypothetical protein
MKERITGEEVKAMMIECNNDYVYSRQCSICRYPLGYIVRSFEDDDVVFDAGCDCTSRGPVYRYSSFDDIANSYNIQKNDEARESILSKIKQIREQRAPQESTES